MSHIATVTTEIKDLKAAEDAAKALGCQVEHGTKPRYYGTSFGGHESKPCDLVIKLPGKYDLGLKKNAQGTYDFVCDNELLSGSFGRSDQSRQLLGDNAARFKQEYAAAVAMRLGAKRNVATFRKVRDDGAVVVVLRG